MQQHTPLQSVSIDALLLDTCSSADVCQRHQQQLQSYHSDVIHPSKRVVPPSPPGEALLL